MRQIIALGIVALTIYAFLDVVRSSPDERVGLPRWVWCMIVLLFPLAGPIVWLTVSRNARSRAGSSGWVHEPGRPRRVGPSAPDDDPEFLWSLDDERRRQQRSGAAGTGAGGTASGAGTGATSTGATGSVGTPASADGIADRDSAVSDGDDAGDDPGRVDGAPGNEGSSSDEAPDPKDSAA